MIAQVPRQSITNPDFYSEEFTWLTDENIGKPNIIPMKPNNWDEETTETTEEAGITTITTISKLYNNGLNGWFIFKQITTIQDETIMVDGSPETIKTTSYDNQFYFEPTDKGVNNSVIKKYIISQS